VAVKTAFKIDWAGDRPKPFTYAEQISPAKFGSISYGDGFWTIGWRKISSIARRLRSGPTVLKFAAFN